MTHLGSTLAGREFHANRGRALGLTSLGMPSGEVILPPLVAFLLIYVSWQSIWWGILALLLVSWTYLFCMLNGLMHREQNQMPMNPKQITQVLCVNFVFGY
jgi:MFS family permease